MSEESLARLEVLGGDDAGVAVLRLDRPKVNALNLQMQRQIRDAADEASERDEIAALVVAGSPRAFAAGVDIVEMQAMSHADMVAASVTMHRCFDALARVPKPTVAAVTGYALGGGFELALTCDLRFAGRSATVGQPEILLGVIPGAGGTQRLTRLIGPSRAKDLVYTGRHVRADEALALGMVDRVVADDEVESEAIAYCRQFVGGPALALRAAKDVIDRGGEVDLVTGLEIERSAFAGLFATADRTAGMTSFVEHGPGKATFTGR